MHEDLTQLRSLIAARENAYLILGAMQKAMRWAGRSKSLIDGALATATEADYEHLLRTATLEANRLSEARQSNVLDN